MSEKPKSVALVFVLALMASESIASPTTCSGKIWKIWKDPDGVRWLEIGHGLFQCSAKVESAIGRKILSVCHLNKRCTFQVEVAPRSEREMMEKGGDGVELDERDHLVSVHRGAPDDIGTEAAGITGPDALGCFTRTYDRSHLARYPDQLITAVKLHVHRAPPENLSKYWLLAQFRLRGRDETLRTSGICDEKALGLHCFVECDGGGLDVVPRPRDAMMYLDRINVAACGEDYVNGAGQELTGGKDDRVFRLDRVDDAACAGMKP
jgi:hypothetical protein